MSINADVLQVRELFPGTGDLRVPPFQRGFSWTEREVRALLSDLITAFEGQNTYFLGAIVVIQTRPKSRTDVVDGQQRLTTLTMMLAVLRDLAVSSDAQSRLHRYVAQDKPTIMTTAFFPEKPKYQLTLNHHDNTFFEQHVQERDATNHVESLDISQLAESEQGMVRAIGFIRDAMLEMSPESRSRFATWLTDQVSFVRVRVTEHNLGYRVFLGLNGRGLPLADHDILKSILIEQSGLAGAKAMQQSDRWMDYSRRIGSAAFGDLLKQIRWLYDRQSRGEFIDGLVYALKPRVNISEFLQTVLPRFVDAYEAAVLGRYDRIEPGPSARRSLSFLRAMDHVQWRALALYGLYEFGEDADRIARFMSRLERLANFLQHAVSDRETRQRRYRRVQDALDAGAADDQESPFDLSSADQQKFLARLSGRFGNFKQRRGLALRLNAILTTSELVEPEDDATLEHILPRAVPPDSEWAVLWPDQADREELTDSLGNFTLLPHSENQGADRADYDAKLEIYFRPGARVFGLSRDLKSIKSWTPAAVRERRDRHVALLAREWGLKADTDA